jgi:release factor glutamine methyltransferase
MLTAAGISQNDAALDAEVLARHVLCWDRATLLARGRDQAPPGFETAFSGVIERRIRREPVAQIVGHREFWGLEFDVTPDVLIPRPETELLVEEAIAFGRERSCRAVVDVGTGSGSVAVSIACELPDAHVTATDCSERALRVARRNAIRHGVADRMTFVTTDLLAGLEGSFDLIVSNPPYIPDGDAETLQPEVVRFEPHPALFGGPDGLSVIRRLLEDASQRLATGGRVILEFGAGQEDDIRRIATESRWRVIQIRDDLQRIPRTAVLERAGTWELECGS